MAELKEQYSIFEELNKVEKNLSRNLDLSEKIPGDREKVQNLLDKRKAIFLALKSSLDENEKKTRKLELELREKDDRLKKSESKLMECKTNEEYQAAQKELNVQKEQRSKFEEEILALMTDIDRQKEELKVEEAKFKEEEKRLLKEIQEFNEAAEHLQKEIAQCESERQKLSTQLAPEIQRQFERVLTRIKRRAIITIVDGLCTGCNMRVRPQMYNEILGFKAVHCCPHCGRLLIPSPAQVEPGEEASQR